MKYVFMFTRAGWEDSASDDEQQKRYASIEQWFGRLAGQGKYREGNRLLPPHTATTVVLTGSGSSIVDGPYMEAKETIGGYGVFEVADLDEALAIARTFPSPDTKVEIRPVVQR